VIIYTILASLSTGEFAAYKGVKWIFIRVNAN